MKIDFSRNAWNLDEITYAYTYRFQERATFTQKDDCVENRADSARQDGYEYIPLMTKAQYGAGSRITTRCSFDGMGAPFLMIADKLYIDQDGYARFSNYIEVVIYEEGVNVWRMWPKDDTVTWKLLAGVKFAVREGDIHTLTAEIGKERLTVDADGHRFSLYIPDIYTSFHLGVGACEGINRFYDMEIDGTQRKTL